MGHVDGEAPSTAREARALPGPDCTRPVKILQLVQTLDPSTGGVARAVVTLSHALVTLGHSVEIVTLDEPDATWLQKIQIPVHPLTAGLTSYRYSKNLLPWLRKNGGSYDRVVVHGIWQYLSFAAWRRYAGTEIPYYVFPHGMLDPWFKRTFPLKHLKKWLYWPWADYRVLRDARAVIFTSEEERQEARKSFWLYRARETISPLGVEAPASRDTALENVFLAKFPELRQHAVPSFSRSTASEKRMRLVDRCLGARDKDGPGACPCRTGSDRLGERTADKSGFSRRPDHFSGDVGRRDEA